MKLLDGEILVALVLQRVESAKSLLKPNTDILLCVYLAVAIVVMGRVNLDLHHGPVTTLLGCAAMLEKGKNRLLMKDVEEEAVSGKLEKGGVRFLLMKIERTCILEILMLEAIPWCLWIIPRVDCSDRFITLIIRKSKREVIVVNLSLDKVLDLVDVFCEDEDGKDYASWGVAFPSTSIRLAHCFDSPFLNHMASFFRERIL